MVCVFSVSVLVFIEVLIASKVAARKQKRTQNEVEIILILCSSEAEKIPKASYFRRASVMANFD